MFPMNNPKPYSNLSEPFQLAVAILGRTPPLGKSDIDEFEALARKIPPNEREDFSDLWEGLRIVTPIEIEI